MNKFDTHVYTLVRVKVSGTNIDSDPQRVSKLVSDAVRTTPSAWLTPGKGTLTIPGYGTFPIAAVEFADGIENVLVDEIDPRDGSIVDEHYYDGNGDVLAEKVDVSKTVSELVSVLKDHPDAGRGNSKVHFALERLKGLERSLQPPATQRDEVAPANTLTTSRPRPRM